MKILFIVNEFPKLSETFILNQITALIDKGHTVTILANKSSFELKEHFEIEEYNLIKNTKYYKLSSNKAERIFLFCKQLIPSLIRKPIKTLKSLNIFSYGKEAYTLKLFYCLNLFEKNESYDAIQCHFGNNGNLGLFLREIGLIDGPIFTTFHGYDLTSFIKNNGESCYRNLFINGEKFLPISEYWKRKLINLGCDEKKIIVHRMGVDIKKFDFVEKKELGNEMIVTSVARLVEKKGIEFGIRSIADLVNEGYKIKYNIIGDGPLKDHLINLIDKLKMNKYIKVLGWKNQNEIVDILKNSDINLVPSVTSSDGDMEGIPVVIMESMAMGIPVLSTYHSGIPELIIDEKNGFLVNEKDIQAMKNKLIYIINNKEKLVPIVRNANNTVRKFYNMELLNNDLEKILKEEQILENYNVN